MQRKCIVLNLQWFSCILIFVKVFMLYSNWNWPLACSTRAVNVVLLDSEHIPGHLDSELRGDCRHRSSREESRENVRTRSAHVFRRAAKQRRSRSCHCCCHHRWSIHMLRVCHSLSNATRNHVIAVWDAKRNYHEIYIGIQSELQEHEHYRSTFNTGI